MLSTRTVEYSHLEDLVNLLNKKYNSQCELVLNDSKLMPFFNRKKKNTIEFSKRLDTILTLFTAYKYEPEQLHKKLFLYLMANRHVETGNWYNAKTVLKELKKENTLAPLSHASIPSDIVFYLDYQAEAILAHEFGHYIFSLDKDFLVETKQMIKDMILSARKGGIKGIISGFFENGVLRDERLMEELSCDWFAMTVMSERLKNTNDTKIDPQEVFRQIIRVFMSINYLDDILPSKGRNFKKSFVRNTFGLYRVVIVSSCLHDEWEEVTPSLMFEEIRESRQRNRAAYLLLFRKLKYHRMRNDVSYLATEREMEQILKDLKDAESKLFYDFRFSLNSLDFSVMADDSFPDFSDFLDDSSQDAAAKIDDAMSKFFS